MRRFQESGIFCLHYRQEELIHQGIRAYLALLLCDAPDGCVAHDELTNKCNALKKVRRIIETGQTPPESGADLPEQQGASPESDGGHAVRQDGE